MSDAITAPALRVARLDPRGMISLRGDFSDAGFRAAASDAAGLEFPGQREIRCAGAHGLAWMSPDEVLVMVPAGEVGAALATLGTALAGTHHLAADVSDARALFAVAGPGSREVLAKGAPVDLSPAAFGPGSIRRTRLGQVAAAFWMTGDAAGGDAFELVCFRSVAAFVHDWLVTAADPHSLPGHF